MRFTRTALRPPAAPRNCDPNDAPHDPIPTGRLTANWVRHVGALRGPANPYFQARGSTTTAYVSEPATALFSFGSGLSFNVATIATAALVAPPTVTPDSILWINGTLNNAGPAGAAVLQVYFSQDAPTKSVRYDSQLIAFDKVPLSANATGTPFSIPVRVRDMEAWDDEARDYVVYEGTYSLTVGLSSADAAAGRNAFRAIAVAGAPWCRPAFPGAPPCAARRV